MSIPILNPNKSDYAQNSFTTPPNTISFDQATTGFTYANDFNNPHKHLNPNSIYYTKPNEPFQHYNHVPSIVYDTTPSESKPTSSSSSDHS